MKKIIASTVLLATLTSCSVTNTIGETINPTESFSNAKPEERQFLPEKFNLANGTGQGGPQDSVLEAKTVLPRTGHFAKVYGRNDSGDVFWGYSYNCKNPQDAIDVARTYCKTAGGELSQWVFFAGVETITTKKPTK